MVRGRGTRERLEDIRNAAEDALAFAAGLDDTGFAALPMADRRTYRALKNALAEIGEAVKLLPPELPARHPEVDWRGWAGLRDVVSQPVFRLGTAAAASDRGRRAARPAGSRQKRTHSFGLDVSEAQLGPRSGIIGPVKSLAAFGHRIGGLS